MYLVHSHNACRGEDWLSQNWDSSTKAPSTWVAEIVNSLSHQYYLPESTLAGSWSHRLKPGIKLRCCDMGHGTWVMEHRLLNWYAKHLLFFRF